MLKQTGGESVGRQELVASPLAMVDIELMKRWRWCHNYSGNRQNAKRKIILRSGLTGSKRYMPGW